MMELNLEWIVASLGNGLEMFTFGSHEFFYGL